MKVFGTSIPIAILFIQCSAASAQLADGSSLYANAKPYIDDPAPLLKTKVPQLNGMRPNADEAQLLAILNKVGEAILAQMPRVPNLLALEEIAQEQLPPATGMGRGSLAAST